jgi:hypothetical protein
VAVAISFAENRAMLSFEIDPGDGEPEFFRVTAKSDGDRIANRDLGWQADVAIGSAGRTAQQFLAGDVVLGDRKGVVGTLAGPCLAPPSRLDPVASLAPG